MLAAWFRYAGNTSPSGFLCLYSVEFWAPLTTLTIPIVVLWWPARRIPLGHCPHCGYNLTGNESGKCPECSTPVPKQETPA